MLDELGIGNVISLGVGVAGAATGAILLWQGTSGDQSASLTVTPGGVSLRGTF